MNGDNFASELQKLVPSMRELMDKYSYSFEGSEVIRSEYICNRTATKKNKYNDVLLDFVDEFDTSTLLIANIMFSERVKLIDDYYLIGNALGDDLVVSRQGKNVFAVNPIDYDDIVWNVCEKSSDLLKILLLTIKESDNLQKNNLVDDALWRTQIVEKIRQISGDDFIEYFEYIYLD